MGEFLSDQTTEGIAENIDALDLEFIEEVRDDPRQPCYAPWQARGLRLPAPGEVEGDRLTDWVGVYNAYYLCPATYGEFVSTRQMSPSFLVYLQKQAEADGATDVLGGPRATDSGFDELALVYQTDIKNNSKQPHPDTPGHFTCR